MLPLGDMGEIILRSGEISVEDLAKSVGIDSSLAEVILHGLRGVVLSHGRAKVVNRLDLVLSLIERGVDAGRLSRFLSWKEFEAHASRVLREAGFNVVTDVRLGAPTRLQVDVLAFKQSITLVVDCKHWSPRTSTPSRLRVAAIDHVERTRKLLSSAKFWTMVLGGLEKGGKKPEVIYVYPILITLRTSIKGPLAGATIVPVSLLAGFLNELDLYRFDLPHIRASSSKT